MHPGAPFFCVAYNIFPVGARMPRRLIKRYMPNEQTLRSHRHLSWLGHHFQKPALWQLSRKSVSRAFLVGVFCAFLPIPAQMVVAAVFAVLITSNVGVSVGLVWITNPVTMPAIFYGCYRVGSWVLGVNAGAGGGQGWSLASIHTNLAAVWWPMLAGGVICGLALGAVSYVLVNRIWIWHVGRSWRNRRHLRAARQRD